MSDVQFWFVITCIVVLLDLLTWRSRRKLDLESREYWKARDAESKRRHEEHMARIDSRTHALRSRSTREVN